jgi:hypothetical protein
MKTEHKYSGLGIPERYFSDLEKLIFQEIESYEFEKELKNKFGEQTGLMVPDGYFENFRPLKNEKSSIFSMSRIVKLGSAVAACLALLFFSGVFNSGKMPVVQDSKFEELLAEVAFDDIESLELFETEELESFLEENETEEDLDELLEYLIESEEDLEEFTIDILEI